MKFTLNLLKEVITLNSNVTVNDICNTLTIAGIEVEEVIDYTQKYKPFSIAYIKSATPHPDADKLKVCTVQTNVNNVMQDLQIVCGASNAREGIYVVFAPVGTYIPAIDITLSKAKIRGIESFGMMLSEKEVGLSDEHGKIMEFANGTVGQSFADKMNLNDVVFDVAITPNRGDCLGILGIANELQAYGLGTIKPNLFSALPNTAKLNIDINLLNNTCNYFSLYKINNVNNAVENHPKLQAIKNYLTACGFKSISPVVDIVNYCSLLFNQPMHAYNYNSVSSCNVVNIKNLTADANITDLKDKQYAFSNNATKLTTKFLNAQNQEQTSVKTLEHAIPVVEFAKDDVTIVGAFAGIMGTQNTACQSNTCTILLELASFNAVSIALAKRELDLLTDSAYRFERGIDEQNIQNVASFTIALLQQICGGSLESSVVNNNTATKQPLNISLTEINNLTENQFTTNQVKEILSKLNYTISVNNNDLQILAPSYRNDFVDTGVAVADIIRLYGFNNLKEHALAENLANIGKTTTALYDRTFTTKQLLSTLGLLEVQSMSFTSKEMHQEFNLLNSSVHVVNPISVDLMYMRSSLLATLIATSKANILKSNVNFKLQEVANVYSNTNQQIMASGVLVGSKAVKSWETPEQQYTSWDAKNIVNAILENCGLNYANINVETSNLPAYYHPYTSGSYSLGKNIIAYFGQVHPSVLAKLDIKQNIFAFEVFLENIPYAKNNKFIKSPVQLSPFTPVVRDFSFLFSTTVLAQEIVKIVKAVNKNLITSVNIFDIYNGKNMPENTKSVSLSITISAKQNTLTDEEIKDICNNVITALTSKLGGTLRS